jgi:hypothetical protein
MAGIYPENDSAKMQEKSCLEGDRQSIIIWQLKCSCIIAL